MTKLKIYYAHPMSWYHTKEERADVAFLEAQGIEYEVVNPSDRGWELKVSRAMENGYPVMQVFADFIHHHADIVAFRAYKDLKLGAGVGREVLEAQIWDKPIWQIGGTALDYLWIDRVSRPPIHAVLSVAETKRRNAVKQL